MKIKVGQTINGPVLDGEETVVYHYLGQRTERGFVIPECYIHAIKAHNLWLAISRSPYGPWTQIVNSSELTRAVKEMYHAEYQQLEEV